MPRPASPQHCPSDEWAQDSAVQRTESDRREVFQELLAALGDEFNRLHGERGALAEELQQLRTSPVGLEPVQEAPGTPTGALARDHSNGESAVGEQSRAPAASGATLTTTDTEGEAAGDGAQRLQLQSQEDEHVVQEDDAVLKLMTGSDVMSTLPSRGRLQETREQRAFMSLKSRSSLEAEDYYETLYDLTRAFHAICPRKRSSISSTDLRRMYAIHKGTDDRHFELVAASHRWDAAIRALNKALGIKAKGRWNQTAVDIMFDTFIAIMQRKEANSRSFNARVDSSALEAIGEIRDILVREDALRKVAKATNMSYLDMYQAKAKTFRLTRIDTLLKYLDPFIGFVILLNAFVIGLSTDVEPESVVWLWCEITFTIVFVVEFLAKMSVFGCRKFVFGKEMAWNLFDTFVVLVAILDMIFTLVGTMVNLRNFTIMRILRFARLTKLVRVLKLKVFKELALLVNGILAGLRTLVWAMIFLIFVLFGIGVLLTQTVGKTAASDWNGLCDHVQGPDHVRACNHSRAHILKYRKELFGDVPRSMFTVFRCFTEGCASLDGTPLTPHFYNMHGLLVIISYFIVTLFVIFGLFNLIMAVFVENTIENAKHDEARRREARHGEHLRVAKKLQEVVIMFCQTQEEEEETVQAMCSNNSSGWFWQAFSIGAAPLTGSKSLSDPEALSNLSIKVTHEAFHRMLDKPELQEMLDDLDIGLSCRRSLFDVLDANCNGTLEVHELVHGLLKLRGTAEKADVVASLLAIRSMQKSFKALQVISLHQQETVDSIAAAQKRAEDALDAMAGQFHGKTLRERRASYMAARASTPPGLNVMRADAERRPMMPPSQI